MQKNVGCNESAGSHPKSCVLFHGNIGLLGQAIDDWFPLFLLIGASVIRKFLHSIFDPPATKTCYISIPGMLASLHHVSLRGSLWISRLHIKESLGQNGAFQAVHEQNRITQLRPTSGEA
jgi:hypothetical protein